MTFEIIFAVSGVLIIVLLLAKIREMKKQKPLLLRLISLGDERARVIGHKGAHFYADSKEKADFFLNKQLPLHTKNFLNKSELFVQEQTAKLAESIRDSRLLKKDDGISEFFKSISEKENGEIHDTLEDDGSVDSEG